MNAALHRIGPPVGTLTREVRTRGGSARIIAIVEVWGIADPERRGALEHSLAKAICDGFGSGGGSTTARIRLGIDSADRMVRRLREGGSEGAIASGDGPDTGGAVDAGAAEGRMGREQGTSGSLDAGAGGGHMGHERDRESHDSRGPQKMLGAGASVIVHEGIEITLAQVGPAVAYGPGEDGLPLRIPAESPWLRRGERELRPDLEWPAIGTAPGGAAIVHWTRFEGSPGTMIVAATTAAAEHLGREVIAALFATPAARAGNALGVALPENMPAVVLAISGAAQTRRPTASQSELSAAGRLADSARAASEFGAEISVRARPAIGAARTALGKLGLSAAQVLVGLLPSRTPDAVRAEWTRLMAAIAIGLPFAVLVLSALIAARALSDRLPDGESPAGAPAVPELPPNTASDDARGIQRLDEADLVPVPLAGNLRDSREIVVAGGNQYVLNRELSIVELVDGESATATRVLERGSVVGGDVVGAIEDLFWLPGAFTDGAAIAPGDPSAPTAPSAPADPAAPTPPSGSGRAAALDGAGRVWAIDGDAISAVRLGAGPRWRAVSRAAGFDGALYALDKSGDIFRYDLAEPVGNAPPGVAWLASGEELDNAIDLAIGGSVWVLYGDGRLISFVGGRRSSVGPLGLPTPLREARSIYSTPDGNRLFISDAGSGGVIVLDGDGTFVAELRLPAQPAADPGSDAEDGRFSELHSIWWDRDASIMWVVAGNVLFRAPFDR